MLTTFLTPLCVLATWTDIQTRVKEFMVCLLALMSGMIGVFGSLDLFLFYVFWEVMLIPMYLLIGVWGNRLGGSMRPSFLPVHHVRLGADAGGHFGPLLPLCKTTGTYTFDLIKMYGLNIPFNMQYWMFWPSVWPSPLGADVSRSTPGLPDAHTEAPTVGSVILAAVLLKMGTYGFLRFNMPLFPPGRPLLRAAVQYPGGHGIVLRRPGLHDAEGHEKARGLFLGEPPGLRHVGLFTFTAAGIQGGIIQMINHGLSTGALFLCVGMIYERRHTRMIAEFGGLATSMHLSLPPSL